MSFAQGHALVIGVGTHQFAPKANVPITKADAAAVAAILCDPSTCGYPATQVKFIHDAGATKAGILAELDALAQRAGEKDTVFLFYAGHGALGTDGNYYFVSHDAQLQGNRVVAKTGVSEGELLAKLRALKAQRVLMIFNACFSGNLSQSLDPALDLEPEALAASNLAEETAAALLGTGQGRIIITACGEAQKSYFFASDPNTIFTQALLAGLRGKGVSNSGGFISAFSLYEHVYATVNEFAQEKLQTKQEPELTVLKGVGPFAVALYKGAVSLGDFDDSEPVPQSMAVREVRPEKSTRIFNQRVHQSGGLNFGQGNEIKIDGDVFGGDKVAGPKIDARGAQGFVYGATGPVTQHYGSQIDTGGGTYVGGGVNTGSGDFVGRDKTVHGDKVGGDKISVGDISGNSGIAIGRDAQAHVNTSAAGITPEQFSALIKQLRAALATAQLDSDERAAVQQDLDNVEAQLVKSEPKLSLIKRGLNNVKDVIEAATGIGTITLTLSSLVQRAIEMAEQTFK